MSGDEYGCLSHCSVFKENYIGGTNLHEKWGGNYNFTLFIMEINKIIRDLPPIERGEHTEHFVYNELPDAFIVIKHFHAHPSKLIILNIGNENILEISDQHYNNICTLSNHNKNQAPILVMCYKSTPPMLLPH